jgi:hypothetical protein
MSRNFDDVVKLVRTNVDYVMNKCKDHPDVFKHYAMLISVLSSCYADEDNNAVILANINGSMAIMSINSTEIQITKLMDEAHEYLMAKVMADAPEKSMFN